jgi:hypothetical protein
MGELTFAQKCGGMRAKKYAFLKSPLYSCVSITFPAASYTRIATISVRDVLIRLDYLVDSTGVGLVVNRLLSEFSHWIYALLRRSIAPSLKPTKNTKPAEVKIIPANFNPVDHVQWLINQRTPWSGRKNRSGRLPEAIDQD